MIKKHKITHYVFFLSTSVRGEIFQRQQFIQSSSFNCKQSKTFRFAYSTSKEDELNSFQGNLIQDQGKKKKIHMGQTTVLLLLLLTFDIFPKIPYKLCPQLPKSL